MGVKTFLWSDLENKQRTIKFSAKNIKAIFIACELSVKRVVDFGVVLYRYQ